MVNCPQISRPPLEEPQELEVAASVLLELYVEQ